jgi:hypothetical protein
LLAQLLTFAWTAPSLDYHALAPEIIVAATIVVLILVDVFTGERSRWASSSIAGIGLLLALIPIATLAYDGVDRAMFGGGFVVDNYALVLKALFLVAGYVVILLSTNYIAEGDYHEGEYYTLLLSSVLGMMVMASARDLISIFIAIELVSIPAYMLAAWRKRDQNSNEAGLKYYLMGVFASAILLYGMSLIFGITGSTLLVDIGAELGSYVSSQPIITLGIAFVLIGFAFKVSGDVVPCGCFKGRWFRRHPQRSLHWFLRPSRCLGTTHVGARRAVDDRWQSHCSSADKCCAHAGLFGHRAGRLHPRSSCGCRSHSRHWRRSTPINPCLPAHLRRNEPRSICRSAGGSSQDTLR